MRFGSMTQEERLLLFLSSRPYHLHRDRTLIIEMGTTVTDPKRQRLCLQHVIHGLRFRLKGSGAKIIRADGIGYGFLPPQPSGDARASA